MINYFRILRLFLIFTIFSVSVFSTVLFSQTIGVAIAPKMGDGDRTEQLIYEYLGGRSEINQIFVPNNADDFFNVLIKLKDQGKQLHSLIIAGHGAKENPGILFKQDALLPNDVNMQYQCEQRWIYQRIAEDNRKNDRDATIAEREIAKHKNRIKLL